MHAIVRQLLAALGGVVFIIIGLAILRERRELSKFGRKMETLIYEIIFISVGVALVVFGVGSIVHNLNHPKQ